MAYSVDGDVLSPSDGGSEELQLHSQLSKSQYNEEIVGQELRCRMKNKSVENRKLYTNTWQGHATKTRDIKLAVKDLKEDTISFQDPSSSM